jgi:hypothetical protein
MKSNSNVCAEFAHADVESSMPASRLLSNASRLRSLPTAIQNCLRYKVKS